MARRGHKAFTTWDYRCREFAISIPVTLVDEDKSGSFSDEKKTYFLVHLDEPPIHEQDSDINRLRETVFVKLAELVSIDWKPMLLVVVSCSRSALFDRKKQPANTPATKVSASGVLCIIWERWQIATLRGKQISRQFSNYYTPFRGCGRPKEQPREVWEPSQQRWPLDKRAGGSKHRNRDTVDVETLIDDTPENRLALEAIADNIEKLYQTLSQLLGAAKIQETLAAITSNQLLSLLAPQAQKRGRN